MQIAKSGLKRAHDLYHTLDGMRGVAALLIVFRHTEILTGKNLFHQSYLAVDMFFVLSGFVIANAYEKALLTRMSARTFLAIRAIRLYPLYLLGLVLSVALATIDGRSWVSLAWHGVLSLAFLPNPGSDLQSAFVLNGPGWSLFFEILVNVVYALFLPFIVRSRLLAVIGLSAAALVICAVLRGADGIDAGWTVATLPIGLIRVTCSFYIGVLIFRAALRRPIEAPAVLGGNAASWALILTLAGVLTASPPDWAIPFFDIVSVLIVFPGLLYLGIFTRPTGMTAMLFRQAGLVSFALYILHVPLAGIAEKAYESITTVPPESVAPWVGVVFVLALVPVCLLLDAFYDSPLRNLLKRRLDGPAKTPLFSMRTAETTFGQ